MIKFKMKAGVLHQNGNYNTANEFPALSLVNASTIGHIYTAFNRVYGGLTGYMELEIDFDWLTSVDIGNKMAARIR